MTTKLLGALALCAAVCGSMSASADVTSANTVGFQTKTVAADTWYMLAPQFNGVAANSDEEIDLLKVLSVSGITPQAYAVATAASICTQIQVYENGGYTPYYYINNGRQTGVEGTGSLVGWGKNRTLFLNDFVQPGQSFWIKAYSSGSLTFKFPGVDK